MRFHAVPASGLLLWPPDFEGIPEERNLLQAIHTCRAKAPGPDCGQQGHLVMTNFNFVNFNPRALRAGLLIEDRLKLSHLSKTDSFVSNQLAFASLEDLLSHGWQHDAEPEQELVRCSAETPLLDEIFDPRLEPGAQLLPLSPLSECGHVAAILELRGRVLATIRSLLGLELGSAGFQLFSICYDIYIPQWHKKAGFSVMKCESIRKGSHANDMPCPTLALTKHRIFHG